jgi:ribonuclease III
MKRSCIDKERLKILSSLEKKIAYRFRDISLLSTALTHRSYVNENQQLSVSDNERFEFLGDAVLGLCVSDLIIKKYADFPEGALTQIRSALVNEKNLAQIASDLQIGECLLIGRGEEISGSRKKRSFLADTFEAVIAAVYLDSSFEKTKTIITKIIEPLLEDDDIRSLHFDYKTALQEYCQKKYKSVPEYVLLESAGPDHAKTFKVEVTVTNKAKQTGLGNSKKEAEKQAAQKAWKILQNEED